jgi:hypothetical protein
VLVLVLVLVLENTPMPPVVTLIEPPNRWRVVTVSGAAISRIARLQPKVHMIEHEHEHEYEELDR